MNDRVSISHSPKTFLRHMLAAEPRQLLVILGHWSARFAIFPIGVVGVMAAIQWYTGKIPKEAFEPSQWLAFPLVVFGFAITGACMRLLTFCQTRKIEFSQDGAALTYHGRKFVVPKSEIALSLVSSPVDGISAVIFKTGKTTGTFVFTGDSAKVEADIRALSFDVVADSNTPVSDAIELNTLESGELGFR